MTDVFPFIFVALVSMGASFVQSVTGFGFGILAMIFLPNILPSFAEANILSSILSTVTSFIVLFSFFRKIHWKNLIFPLIGSALTNYIAVKFVQGAKSETLTLLLGIALVCLSIYFFFFSEKIKIKVAWYTGLGAGLLSGLLSGLFAIGGPPVVIYYLQSENSTDEYVATISAFFIFSGILSIAMKAGANFMTQSVWICLLIGILCMPIGTVLGKCIRNRTNPKKIKKLIYGFMAISGVIHCVSSLL